MKYDYFIFLISILRVYTLHNKEKIIDNLVNKIFIQIKIDKHTDSSKKIPNHDDSNKIPLENMISRNHACSSNCLKCDRGQCTLCQFGLYSFLHGCFDTCPFDTYADNIEMKCKLESQNPISSKAYTMSRCINACGKVFADCSCNPVCEKTGECCSDYKICDFIKMNSNNKCQDKKCKYCTKDGTTCLQCKKEFFYYKNNCLKKCPINSNENRENLLCFDSCPIENCEKCEGNLCKMCQRGWFLQNNSCVEICDESMIANRKDFSCQKLSEKPFFWIFPSRGSCHNNCGKRLYEADCSCEEMCINKGNCCQDYEDHCRNYLKKYQENQQNLTVIPKNPHLEKKIEKIKTIIEKKLVPKEILIASNKNISLEKKIEKPQPVLNSMINHFIKNIDQMKTLQDHLKQNFDTDYLFNKGNADENTMLSMYLNGNVTINSLSNNENLNLINQDNQMIDSNNLKNSTKSDLLSFNNASSVKSSGDINYSINKGLISTSNDVGEKVSRELAMRKLDIEKHYKIDHTQVFENDIPEKSPFDVPVKKSSFHQKVKIGTIQDHLNSTPSNNSLKNNNSVSSKELNEYTQNNFKNDVEYNPIVNSNSENSTEINKTIDGPDSQIKLEPNNTNITTLNESAVAKDKVYKLEGLAKALLIGDRNIIQDNHLINNIIRVHNTYILTKKLLQSGKFNPNFNLPASGVNASSINWLINPDRSNTSNSTPLNHDKITNNPPDNNIPSTIIIVNSNKITKNYPSNGECKNKLCRSCENNKCKKCKPHSIQLVDYSCVCKEGYFYNEEFNRCDKCNHLCSSCINSTICNSCIQIAKLVDNSTCQIISSLPITVLKCEAESIELCAKCNEKRCTKCKKNALFVKEENKCICKESHINFNNECILRKCNELLKVCLKCETENKCSKCKENASIFGDRCYCNQGFIYDEAFDRCKEISKKCERNPQLCETCLNNKCQKCKLHSKLKNDLCECNYGYSFNKDLDSCEKIIPKDMKCDISHKLCLACNNTVNKCITCKDYSEIHDLKCQCKKNYIYSKDTDSCIEKPCDEKLNLCEKCRFNKCQICKENSRKLEGKCECIPGFNYDSLSDSCNKIAIINHNCNEKIRLCKECRDNKCLEYKTNAESEFSNKTHGKCFVGYTYNPIVDECFSDKCTEKKSLCEICKNEKCLNCKENAHFINNKCKCKEGFSKKNDECINNKVCNVNKKLCKACDYDDECAQCKAHAIFNPITKTCECNSDSFYYSKNNECRLKCKKEIKLCESCENNKCIKCKINSLQSDNSNTCQCIEGFKYDHNKDICISEKCDKKSILCKMCQDNKCIQCVKHSEFLPNREEGCKCVEGYEYNKNRNTCDLIVKNDEKCHNKQTTNPLCLRCKDNNCIQCSENSNLNKSNVCQCDEGFTYDKEKLMCMEKVCTNVLCLKCKKGKCQECKINSNFNLKSNKCECDNGYIYNSEKDSCLIDERCDKKLMLCNKCTANKCIECKINSEFLPNREEGCKCVVGYKYSKNTENCDVISEKLSEIIDQKCHNQGTTNPLCVKCKKGKCQKCKIHSNFNIKSNKCECDKGYTYNSEKDSCLIVERCDDKETNPLCLRCKDSQCIECSENSHVKKNNICQCDDGFTFDKEKVMCKEKPCTKVLCVKCKKGKCQKCKIHSNFNIKSNKCECDKGYTYNSEKDSCLIDERCDDKETNPLCLRCKDSQCIECSENSHIKKYNICQCDDGFTFDKEKVMCKEKPCTKVLCVKCKKGKCQECKIHSNFNIKSNECECDKGYTYNSDNDSCVNEKCDKKLILCNKCKANKCKLCKENSSLNKKSKLCECNNEYYYNIEQDLCISEKCDIKIEICEKCKRNKCIKCRDNSTLNKTSSLCECNEGYYMNTDLDICMKEICNKKIELCEVCKRNKCKKCKENSKFDKINNICIPQKGYLYKKKEDKVVKDKCHELKMQLCLKCKDGLCTKCKKRAQYNNKTNICNCEEGYFLNKTGDFCQKIIKTEEQCQLPSKLCINCKLEKCFECKNKASLKGAVCQCNENYFYNKTIDSCIKNKCSESTLCSECSENICKACKANAEYKSAFSCKCKKNFKYNLSNDTCSKMCQNPIKLCDKCVEDECRKCKLNSHYIPEKNFCECDKDYVYNSVKDTCEKEVMCKSDDLKLCNNCTQGVCKQCKNNSSLNPVSKKCECDNGFMFNFLKDYCFKNGTLCKVHKNLCLNCKENDTCNECKFNAYFDKGKCKCKQGFIYNRTLDRCDELAENCGKLELCKKCKDDKCLDCKQNSILSSNYCSCLKGFEIDKKKDQCKKIKIDSQICDKNIILCDLCSDNTICVECSQNSHKDYITGKCVCNSGFEYSFTANKCISIDKCLLNMPRLCKKCKDGKCTKCKDFSEKVNKNCTCQEGFIYNTTLDKCNVPKEEKCDPKSQFMTNNPLCIRCSNNECAQCNTHSILTDTLNKTFIISKCICDKGYKYDEQRNKCVKLKCFKHRKLCSKCDEKTGKCIKCKLNSKLNNDSSHCECFPSFDYDEKNEKCTSQCRKGKFYDATLNKCKKCNDNCKSCFDKSNKNCIKCIENSVMNGTTCECPEDFKINIKKSICQRKTPLPLKEPCVNNTVADLNKGICLPISPYEIKPSEKEAVKKRKCKGFDLCNSCEYSKKKRGCANCKKNSKLNIKTRDCNCLPGFYLSERSDSCRICHPLCSKCVGPLNTDCLSCNKKNDSIKFMEDDTTCICNDNFKFNKTTFNCDEQPKLKEKKLHNEYNGTSTNNSGYPVPPNGPGKNETRYPLSPNGSTTNDPNSHKILLSKDMINKIKLAKKENDNDENRTSDLTYKYFPELGPFPINLNKSCDKGFKLNTTTNECVDDKRSDDDKPIFVFTYYLHGIRSPKSINKRKYDIFGQKWSNRKILTKVGIRQDYVMGQYLQNEYMYRTNFLNVNRATTQVRFESAASSPPIMSSYSFLNGLFPFQDAEMSYKSFKEMDEKFFNKKQFKELSVSTNPIFDKKQKVKFSAPTNKKSRLESRFNSISQINSNYSSINHRVYKQNEKKNPSLFVPEDYIKESGMKSRALPYGMKIFPVHSFGNWSHELGIADMDVCIGAQSYINYNFRKYRSEFNKILEKISKYGDIFKMFNLPSNTHMDFETLYQITDAFIANKKIGNKNFTSNFKIPEEVYKILRREFLHDLAFKIIYGDKELLLAKVIVSPSFQTLLSSFEEAIKRETKKVKKTINKIRNNNRNNQKKIKTIDKNSLKYKLSQKLYRQFKFYVYFPKESIFWGFVVFFSRILNQNYKLPLHSSFIQFELSVNSTGFNLTKFLEEEEIFNNKTDPRYRELTTQEIIERNTTRNEYIGNIDRYRVDIKLNNKTIVSIPFTIFKNKVDSGVLSIEDITKFCFPKKINLGLIICIILFALIILQLLIISCIFAFRA